jgi:L-methionine (R)-S-oxide reductase
MYSITPVAQGTPKADAYKQIYGQLAELIQGETDFLANAANTVSLLFSVLPDVNWLGFYFLHGNELGLGPFQGKPACSRIPLNNGVCGAAATKRETVIVPDVSQFSGHIMCDSASKSEISVPLLNWGRLLGVLDVDSPVLNRFDEDDADGLESLMSLFLSCLTTNDLPDFEALAANVTA